MAKENLPLQVDPFRFADHGTHLHGSIPIQDMERLRPSLFGESGTVKVDITFGVDQQQIRFMRGHLEAQLVLQCQRCMGTLNYEILSDFAFGLVQAEEEVPRLPSRYEPLIVKDSTLLIQDVIEDELILSLPIVAMHNEDECNVKLPLVASDEGATAEKENPFKVIELLRKK